MKPGGAHKLWGVEAALALCCTLSMAQLHAQPDIDSNGRERGLKGEGLTAHRSDPYNGFNTKC